MKKELKERLRKIKLLILDVDGVLTDGSIVYSSNGEEIKTFNVHDGYGIEMLRMEGIPVAIITGRTSQIVEKRAKDLKIEDLIQGTIDKVTAAETFAKKYNITFEEMAFMGDDLFDIPLLQKVGFSSAPKNARKEVKRIVHYVTKHEGGKGAVREVIDMILEAKRKEKNLD
ncbi:MAG: HAD-IIIA family hydrolase [Ignavibacteria bacterium]|nr:HAD-IIIA family hydrolase [Ignavibacteria bacterium]